MTKLAALVPALLLVTLAAGCGKSSKSLAPAPAAASSGLQSRQDAQPIAQETAQMAISFVEQARSMIGVATMPGTRPARLRPAHSVSASADSSSWTYAFQGFDVNGAPIDYVTQAGQVASMQMDWRWYFRTASDSVSSLYDYRWHTRLDGFLPAATRFVATAIDTSSLALDEFVSGYHIVYAYDGLATVSSVAWEKSGTPTYPVAGTITAHWHYLMDETYQGRHYTGNQTVDCAITYNGTRYATVTVGSYTFTLDLESGTIS